MLYTIGLENLSHDVLYKETSDHNIIIAYDLRGRSYTSASSRDFLPSRINDHMRDRGLIYRQTHLTETYDMYAKLKSHKIKMPEYAQMYMDVIKRNHVELEDIVQVIKSNNVLLIGYKARPEMCHRVFLCRYIQRDLYPTLEWKNMKPPKPEIV